MAFFNRMAAMAAAGLLCSTVSASAAVLIDLTDKDFIPKNTYAADGTATTGLASGLPGVTFTITGSGAFNNNQTYDGAGNAGCLSASLQCETDGFGISDDEVNGGQAQSLTLTFSDVVGFQTFYFIDAYNDGSGTRGTETVQITINGSTYEAKAKDPNPPSADGGFLAFALPGAPIFSTTATFTMSLINGTDDGTSDAALAGLRVSAVPIPAAGFLLLGGLAGLGVVARKRKAA